MKKQIVSVSKLQNAKVMAVLYLVISLPLVFLMAIPAFLGHGGAFPLFMLILMPIMYTVIGFVLTLFGAWVYNIIAARIGGFEFSTAEVAEQ